LEEEIMWIIMAVLSAFFAGLTAILAKCGIKKTDSDVATAVRTVVVLVFSWLMVLIIGSAGSISDISGKSLLFLVLSGIATGASWICYFKALSVGNVNKVVPVDKSSTVLSVILAIILFGETNHLAVKLVGTALLAVGIFLMIEKKESKRTEDVPEERTPERRIWLPYAVGSAVFAALTTILAKVGIEGVDSNLATAIRTCVVVVMAWVMVFITSAQGGISSISRKSWIFLILSGLATGASWLCYYKALQMGEASKVVPIDKLSVVITLVLAFVFLHEEFTAKSLIGCVLIGAGTLIMVI
jgi:transporter family protein